MKVFILGGDSQVGGDLARQLAEIPQAETELASVGQVAASVRIVVEAIERFCPDFVVNAYSIDQLDQSNDPERAHLQLLRALCRAVKRVDGVFIHLSSAMVFDSARGGLFSEHDRPRPRSAVSQRLLVLERMVTRHSTEPIILRCGWIFGAHRDGKFRSFLRRLELGQDIVLHSGLLCAPTPSHDVASILIAMMQQLGCGATCRGTFHYSSSDTTTSRDFVETVITLVAGYGKEACRPVQLVESDIFEQTGVPYHPILDCQKILNNFGIRQRPWRSALTSVIKAID